MILSIKFFEFLSNAHARCCMVCVLLCTTFEEGAAHDALSGCLVCVYVCVCVLLYHILDIVKLFTFLESHI